MTITYQLQLKHENNKNILLANGFTITQYLNTADKQVLYAHHKDGRKVKISC